MRTLSKVFEVNFEPVSPFNFKKTVYNPSHFPIPMENFQDNNFWCTFRFNNQPFGVKLNNRGDVENPKINIKLYAAEEKNLDYNRILKEVKYHFGLNEDITKFYKKFKDEEYLKPVIERMKGVRSKTKPLYETTMISVLLQNTSVGRSVSMMEKMLEKYSEKLKFDERELYSIWRARDITGIKLKELRNLKLGYRSKYIKRISESFTNDEIVERNLRDLDKENAKNELTSLHGIGPASADILLFESLRFYNARDYIPPWEQKLFSRILYSKEKVERKKIEREIEERYGKWKALAFWYLQTDLFWRHESEPIDWLEEEIRM